jgi:hypothetical protein
MMTVSGLDPIDNINPEGSNLPQRLLLQAPT